MLILHTMLSLLAGLAFAQPTVPPTRHMSAHLAIDADFADPAVTKHNGIYYAFATNNRKNNVQVATSKDFKTWTLHTNVDALPRAGAWARQRKPQVWAPDVVKIANDRFVLYYSARIREKRKAHCIGVAVSKNIMGPYVPHDEPFACPLDQGGAIDVSGFKDPKDGNRYAVYKIDGNSIGHGGICGNTASPIVPTPIMLQRLAVDGVTKIGAPVQILDRSRLDGPLVEAPSLTRTDSGKYVLFFSSNCFATEWYDIAYAMADNIQGPYIKGGPLAVTGTSGLRSPGGADIAPGGKRMVFHANIGHGRRGMYTADIGIDAKRRAVYA